MKGLATTYELARQFLTTDPVEVDLDELKSGIDAEYVNRGIDAYVDTVKKVRAPYEDVFVVYSYVSTSSPIDPVTAILIIAIVLVILTGAGLVYVSYNLWTVFNRAKEPYDDLRDLVISILDGLSFPDIPDMIEHIKINFPDFFATHEFCDICGQAFETLERMQAHRIACPDLKPAEPPPVPPPVPPEVHDIFDQLWASVTKLLESLGLPVPPKPVSR